MRSAIRPAAAPHAIEASDLVLAEVRALRAEVADLKRLIERPHARSLSRADRATLSRVLPVLAGVFGSELWTAREVLAHTSDDLRIVLAGWSSKALGRLLKRGAGSAVDGLCVVAEGDEAGSTLWCVRRSS